MCRLAAYLGKEINLHQFLQDPEHSLIKQSWAPKEMQEGTLNADGFGLTWLSKENVPCTYKNMLPIWSDTNLEGLGFSLSSHLWLANVRSATPGQGISEANTQPFVKDNLIFTHNGCIKLFSKEFKTALLDILSSDIRAEINGDSDSLYMFALLLQHLKNGKSITDSVKAMMNELKGLCLSETQALINLVLSDGKYIYACRHAINAQCPSLYYCIDNNSIRVASEPLTTDENWQSIPKHSLFVFNHSNILENYTL